MSSFLYLGATQVITPPLPTLVCASKGVFDFSMRVLALIEEYEFQIVPFPTEMFDITPVGGEFNKEAPSIALPVQDIVLYQPFLQRLRYERLIDKPLYLEAAMVFSTPLPFL
jgi:hypothetical protein